MDPPLESAARRQEALIRWLILSAAAAVALGYFRLVDLPYLDARRALHDSILSGEAPSPYRYRVLVPGLVEILRRILSPFAPERTAFLAAYATYDLAVIFLLLTAIYVWCRVWFSRMTAIAGALFTAAVLPVALADHYFQPWSLLEAALFTAGLMALHRRRHGVFAMLVLVAALNKETGLLLPVAALATARAGFRARARVLALPAAYVAIWAGTYAGLRLLLGSAPHSPPPAELLARNLTRLSLARTVVNVTLFLGIFWFLAASGYRRAPIFLRRAALVAPPYLAAVAIWGLWYEVRLLMPLYAIAIPLGLSSLAAVEEGERP